MATPLFCAVYRHHLAVTLPLTCHSECFHVRPACKRYVVASWLLVAAAAQAGSSRSQPAECDVAGFVLKWQQLPQRRLSSQAEAVLHTLQIDSTANLRQAPNLAATAAACKRNTSCVMFTSDGFLIGVYRTAHTLGEFNATAVREGPGPLLWVPMLYCSGLCCGTWVSEKDLEQQLLTPAGNGSVQTVAKEDLADDRVTNSWYFDADVMSRFCALAKDSSAMPAARAQG
mgnify:CR=1 FL=1